MAQKKPLSVIVLVLFKQFRLIASEPEMFEDIGLPVLNAVL